MITDIYSRKIVENRQQRKSAINDNISTSTIMSGFGFKKGAAGSLKGSAATTPRPSPDDKKKKHVVDGTQESAKVEDGASPLTFGDFIEQHDDSIMSDDGITTRKGSKRDSILVRQNTPKVDLGLNFQKYALNTNY